MATVDENVITEGAENRSSMLEKGMHDSNFQIKAEITIPTTESSPEIKCPQTLEDLIPEEKLRKSYDIKATNIIILGLPIDIYTLVNHHKTTKAIWDRVKKLMEGTELTKQERESKLYDDFDRFTSKKENQFTLIYLRYAKLINDRISSE
ncbi:hypothetical protein Tco_0322561 [Tanacetum coccineum]